MYIKDGTIYTLAEIRRLHPSISIPVGGDITQLGYHAIEVVPPPVRPEGYFVERGEPEEYEPGKWRETWVILPVVHDPQMIRDSIVSAVQDRLDSFAHTRNYDGILSAATYATSTIPRFAVEGQYAVAARDATWARLYEILAEVESGVRPAPTGYSDIEGELPTLGWPE